MPIHQRYRQTDGRHAIGRPRFPLLCVHQAVKSNLLQLQEYKLLDEGSNLLQSRIINSYSVLHSVICYSWLQLQLHFRMNKLILKLLQQFFITHIKNIFEYTILQQYVIGTLLYMTLLIILT